VGFMGDPRMCGWLPSLILPGFQLHSGINAVNAPHSIQ
jgi:hypothetical protein